MAAMDLMALMAVIALMAVMIAITVNSEFAKCYELSLMPEMLDTTAAQPTSASIPSWLSKHPK